jgi:hypothetical protein
MAVAGVLRVKRLCCCCCCCLCYRRLCCAPLCRHLPPSSASWDAAAAAHLARSIAELAAGQACDAQFRSPWAVELAERMPQVRGAVVVGQQ